MVIHAYQNVICVSSLNPAVRKIFGIGLDWIRLLKSDYSYLIKYTVLLVTLSSDRSNDPYNFKDGSIRPVLECGFRCESNTSSAWPKAEAIFTTHALYSNLSIIISRNWGRGRPRRHLWNMESGNIHTPISENAAWHPRSLLTFCVEINKTLRQTRS
jgi:hypothetical protein